MRDVSRSLCSKFDKEWVKVEGVFDVIRALQTQPLTHTQTLMYACMDIK